MKRSRDYFWNTLAGVIEAAEAVIMGIIVTRVTGLKDAGYLTIAFAIGNLLMTVGKYGVYPFQVTDHKGEYSYRTYLKHRCMTVGMMLAALVGYLIYGYAYLSYNSDKMITILSITVIYMIESFEDLLKAGCQCVGRLYQGARLFIIRWLGILVTFVAVIVYTRNMQNALILSGMVSLLIFAAGYIYLMHKYPEISADTGDVASNDNSISVAKACFPLFLSNFVIFYVNNCGKYALERYGTAEIQACYGFVAMPVFVIGLLNGFIYQPRLVGLAEEYYIGEYVLFNRHVRRQYGLIGLITVVCIAGAAILGIPVLSILYNTDLTSYKAELLVLVFSGCFMAISGYQAVVLTIVRKQKVLLAGYIPVAVIALLFVGQIVKYYGTMGAAVAYLVFMVTLCIIYEISIVKELHGCIKGMNK